MRRRLLRAFLGAAVLYTLFSIAGGITLAEMQLHLWRKPLKYRNVVVQRARAEFQTSVEDVQITARDGIVLRGWYLRPAHDHGRDAILLHGITDNREGMVGFAPNLLKQGYRVLLPDARDHGESGGDTATYGLLERDDIHRWVDWLYSQKHSGCVYGLGESLGAALLLQSLAVEQRYCAVVADSSFSTFRQIAYDRVGFYTHTGRWFGHTIGVLPVEIGIAYARFRYGLDLTQASPEAALANNHVPVMLIHGKLDENIPAWHSERMARDFAGRVEFWEVANAYHCGAVSQQPQIFWSKVLGWYAGHATGPTNVQAPNQEHTRSAGRG